MTRRARLSFALATLVFLFFLEAARLYASGLLGEVAALLGPRAPAGSLLRSVLSLLPLLLPALPASRLLGRFGTVAVAASLVAAARFGAVPPLASTRLFGSSLVLAGGALFLGSAVGYLPTRALASAVPAAMLLDQLLRLAGWSYDPSLRGAWLPAQIAGGVGVALLLVALRPRDQHDGADGAGALERRAGGLRLRGAAILGLIFFLASSVLGAPPVVARWTGTIYPVAALLLAAAAAAAAALAAARREADAGGRHGAAAIGLAAGVFPAAMVLWPSAARAAAGLPAAVSLAAAHFAVLLLPLRALSPSGGRRGAWTSLAMLVMMVVPTVLFAAAFFPASTLGSLAGALPWLFICAALGLGVLLLFLPRQQPSPPLLGGPAAAALAVGAVLLAAVGAFGRAAAVARGSAQAPAGASSMADEPPRQLRITNRAAPCCSETSTRTADQP